MPFFVPHNLPPTAILKADRKRIFAGIDNSVIASTGSDDIQVYLVCDNANKIASGNNIDVTVEYIDSDGLIQKVDWDTYAKRKAQKVAVRKILSMKLKYLNSGATDRLADNERVYIKTFTNDYVVGCISLGNPYISEDGAGYSVFVDASESLTKAGNVSIVNQANDTSDGHYFDIGKYNFGHQAEANGSTSLAQVSDSFNNTNVGGSNSGLLRDSPIMRIAYNFNPTAITNTPIHYTDNYGRFNMEERMIRAQVRDNHTDNSGTGFKDNTYNMSLLENWRFGKYTSSDADVPSSLEREACLLFYGKNAGSGGSATWHNLVHNTTYTSDVAHYTGADLCTLRGGDDEYLLMVQTRKFNKIYIAMRNETVIGSIDPVKINFRYAAIDEATGKRFWKALPVVDNTAGTLADGTYVSLLKSGTISFDMPEDWERGVGNSGGGWLSSTWDSKPPRAAGSNDPNALWDFEGYAIMMNINNAPDDGSALTPLIQHVFPCDNSHSVIVNVEDPHHISLNNIALAQNVSWSRKGKYYTINDRMGRSEVRRLGVEGGIINLGGVQLDDSSSTGASKPSFKLVKEYQQKDIPVYYDLQMKNNDYIRFYGKITDMNEDVPTGKAVGRWSVNMQLSHVVEFDSTGAWINSSLVGLGGEIEDEPKYIL